MGNIVRYSQFQSADWYKALRLDERLINLKDFELFQRHKNQDSALVRLQRWQSQAPFDRDNYFSQRLNQIGITNQEQLSNLLGEPIESVKFRIQQIPMWLQDIEQAFSENIDCSPIPTIEPFEPNGIGGFLNLIEPLICQARKKVSTGVSKLLDTYPSVQLDPRAITDILFENSVFTLLSIVSRTCVLELNIARMRGQLTGDTPEERFQSYLHHLHERGNALSILHEYPPLARLVSICLNQWVTFSLDFLNHLCHDWSKILATFFPDTHPGSLISVRGNAGDRHQGGRSVMILQFQSGKKLVYKPRSLAIDVHFQQLLEFLNEKGMYPRFRLMQVLDCQDHGWVEFIDSIACNHTDEVERFYTRLGAYLAILYAMGAIDFHYENLIACGEHPILIDLETLFEHGIDMHDPIGSISIVTKALKRSVLRVGLLPMRMWANEESEGIDFSGIGNIDRQYSPQALPYWEDLGTDHMHLKDRKIQLSGGANRPKLKDSEVEVLEYGDAISRGFAFMYHLLINHRKELLTDRGPISSFKMDRMRVIIRATRVYASLLQESHHPYFLRDALDRDRFFDRLWSAAVHQPELARIIPHELHDLHQHDIPVFISYPSSKHIWSNTGRLIRDFFEESSMNMTKNFIEQLNDEDLEKQLWYIRGSLNILTSSGDVPSQDRQYSLPVSSIIANSTDYCKAAEKVANRINDLSYQGKNDVSWIGLVSWGKGRYWRMAPLEMDFYDGIPGLLLFLAYLDAMRPDPDRAKLVNKAFNNLQAFLKGDSLLKQVKSVGAFSGLGGLIYSLTHLGVLWDDDRLLDQSVSLVALLPECIKNDKQFDIMAGSAGCIAVLLGLYESVHNDQIIATAIQCGDHLLAHAQIMPQGIAWDTNLSTKQPGGGFAHGAAGIAWALLKLAAISGGERFRSAAIEAIRYERTLFSPKANNWRDVRFLDQFFQAEKFNEDIFMVMWCYGAPGIGLARLFPLEYLGDTQIEDEVRIALKTTLSKGFGNNHCLCHGDLGNLDFLMQASRVLNDDALHKQAESLGSAILRHISDEGLKCGNWFNVETPGLMTGIAGIGYQLLRLAAPEQVPSILTLDPPRFIER